MQIEETVTCRWITAPEINIIFLIPYESPIQAYLLACRLSSRLWLKVTAYTQMFFLWGHYSKNT